MRPLSQLTKSFSQRLLVGKGFGVSGGAIFCLLALLLAPTSGLAEPLRYYGYPAPAGAANAHEIYQIPRVSKKFCEDFLARTVSLDVIKRGLQALADPGELEMQASCVGEIADRWDEISGSTQPASAVRLRKLLYGAPPADSQENFLWHLSAPLRLPPPPTEPWAGPLPVKIRVSKVSPGSRTAFELQLLGADGQVLYTTLSFVSVASADLSRLEISEGKEFDMSFVGRILDRYQPGYASRQARDEAYRERRLLARFHHFLARGGRFTELARFCGEYEEAQAEDERFAQQFGVMRFNQPGHWSFAKGHGLTEAEVAAIGLYTGIFYYEINQAIWSGKPLTPKQELYLQVARRALSRLPANSQPLFRRAHDFPAAVSDAHQVGRELVYDAFTSTSTEPSYYDSLNKFRFVIFPASQSAGRAIAPISSFRGEEEVLYPPGTRFRVLSREQSGDSTSIILMEVGANEAAAAPVAP